MNVEDKIKNEFSKNMSIRQIAKYVEKSTSYVESVLKKCGLKGGGEERISSRFPDQKKFVAICKKTGKEFEDYKNVSGALTSHILKHYEIEIPSKFLRKQISYTTGFYWHEKYFDIKEIVVQDSYKCKLCDWETTDLSNSTGALSKHLKNHNIDLDEYVNIFPDETFLKNKSKIEREKMLSDPDNFIECVVCKEKMKKITNSHIKKHGISLSEYKQYFCKETLSNTSRINFREASENNLQKSFYSKKNTNIEVMMIDKMDELGILYEKQFKKHGFYYDFYLPGDNLLIEVDGVYWHGHDRDCRWNKKIFNNIINDFRKSQPNLIRLIEGVAVSKDNLSNINSKEDFMRFLMNNNFDIKNHKLFNLSEHDEIFSKEYCIKDNENLDDEKIISNIVWLWKTFYHPSMNKKFIEVNKRMGDFKIKAILFDEFYQAKKGDNKNLFQIFENDDLLKKVVRYRLGLNKAKEFFDFNIKNLYRGIEVRTMCGVGILPTKQARKIYEKYNDFSIKKKIYDPFPGWGSRFISLKEHINSGMCSYIGTDINVNLTQKYDELLEYFEIDKNFVGVGHGDSTLFNPMVGDIDFIFTSPPFLNDEVYSDNHKIFSNLNDFKQTLMIPVFENCFRYLKKDSIMVIDMKEAYCQAIIESAQEVGFQLIKSEAYKVKKSHFNKGDQKQQFLIEFIKK